jgi:glycosyltransferase involved in cell wall biosynthesis
LKLISIVTPCYNEEKNVELIYQAVKDVMAKVPQYKYEHIFIDNASTDTTVAILRRLAESDKQLKVIVNNRNFGYIRSPYYGLLQARGDAVILIVADLQDPPEMMLEFIKHWEAGDKVVVGVKTKSEENWLIYKLRTMYYRTLNRMTNVELVEHFTGFGLYDQSVIVELRKLNESYPYLRGLISELGYTPTKIPFTQPPRKFGVTKSHLYALYDLVMLGLTSHTIVPMRLATVTGFVLAIGCLIVSFIYLIYKLVFWFNFSLGMAPLVIGMFFLFSVQLAFIGLLGEYVGAVHTHVQRRPLVVERERINFDESTKS